MRAQRPRGIVLISVMFLAVLIAMYVASSAMLTKGQYGAMRATAEDRRAEEAARSGLEYAQARLEENPEWRGDGNGVIIDSGPLMVREERGNVVGILTTSDGGRAQFRIRFNHQDGANGGDAMADPSGPMLIDSRHVSVNNVLNSYQTALPLGDGANYRCQGAVTSYPVPAFSAAVVCEGRVFDGLAAAGSSNLNPPVSNLQASRVVEAFYRVSDFTGEAPAQDAVAMAGGEVDMQLFPNASATQRLSMTNFQGSGPSRFRGRGDISITDMAKNAALVEGSDASLMMLSDKTLTANLGSGVARGSEDSNTDFYKVTWDQAGEPSANAVDVPAGVYVFWAGDQTLHHYNMDFEQYVKHIKKNPTDPGSTPAMPDGMNFVKAGNLGPDGATSTKHRFVITKDVQIRAADGVKDLTIIPRAGAREDLPTTPGGPLPALAAEFNLTEDMTAQEMLTALSAAGLSLSPGGNVHNLLSEVAEGATMTVDGDRSTGMWSNNYGGPFGGPDDDDGADDYGPPPWQPASGTVSWSPSGLNLGGAGGLDVAAALVGGGLRLTGVTNPNLNILSPIGNSGKYKLKDDALARLIFGSTGGDLTEIDLAAASGGTIPAGSEVLGPRDFEVTLAPLSEEGVRVVAPGDIRIAADVKGSGASISAKGDIRLVGVGFDLDAANGEQGTDVSLYSQKNIVISTLRKEQGDQYEFSGLQLRGVLYSWGDLDLKMSDPSETASPDPQKVVIQGTMVAYGGEPGKDRPGKRGGDITIKADQIDLVFDPGYLVGLSGAEGYKISLSPLSQSYRQ